ncbi:MAG: hypothetical protein V1899_03020 [Planctomycetota bacterium]
MILTDFGNFNFATSNFHFRSYDDGITEFESNLIKVPGASGAYDADGTAQSPKIGNAITFNMILRASYLTIDTELATLKQNLFTGQQWLRVLLDDGTTYLRLLAKCKNAKPQRESYSKIGAANIALTFAVAEPFWYADTQVTQTTSVSATPTVIDLNNTGTAPLVKMIMRFNGTAKSPKFLNNTNGYYIQHNGDITSQLWEVDAGAQTIQLAGSDDWANKVIPTTQVGLFKYDVGANDVDFVAAGGGTPSGTVTIIYRVTYQ